MNAVDEVIERLGGKIGAAAEVLDVSYQVLQHWRRERVPAERVLEIERKSGVPRHVLRPDLYPTEPA